MQSNGFSTNKTLNLGGRLIDLTEPKVMGILNVTPDSFYDGNRYITIEAAVRQAEKMANEGAHLIDIGGYSSRSGATDISVEDELQRVTPVIRAVRERFPDLAISVDTFRAAVAQAAIDDGAMMINDISAGELDAGMFPLVAEKKIPYVMMHMRGTPQTMMQHTRYEDLMEELLDYFHPKINMLHAMGAKDIIVDPGFGFAKNIAQNFALLKQLDLFGMLGKPLLVGVSRKSMIWKTLGVAPDEALNGTTCLNTIALLKGASILRVHDVKEAVEAIKLVKFVM